MNHLFDTVAFTDSTAGPLNPQRHRRIAEEIAPTPAEVMALGLGTNDRVARPEPVRRSGGVPLAIERVSYLEIGQTVEFTRSVYRGDADDFVVELASVPQSIKDGA